MSMRHRDSIGEEIIKRQEIMTNYSKNYLLEAGAGAGKTTIIVERIINHIVNHGIEPSSIVAITFTKAASTELAERIQKRALEYLRENQSTPSRDKLERIDEIFTGTIHSFCDLILEEMPFEANLTPGYEIVEDDKEFHNKIWNDFLRNREQEYGELVNLLWKFDIDYRELRPKAIVAMENPDTIFVGYQDKRFDFEDLHKEFEAIKKDYLHLDGSILGKRTNIAKMLISILEEGRGLSHYLSGILRDSTKYDLDPELTYESIVLKRYLESEQGQDYVDFFQKIFGLYEKLNSLAYNSSTDFINMAVDYKIKNYKDQLTFNDLLYRASKLVKESPKAKEHFKNKYKHYYIDEFQDTDPIQAELILHLVDSGEYKPGKHWQDCIPKEGSLFVVGDPKQSIYRFRRADISIYNQVKEIIGRNGESLYLDINFRSTDEICSWVEATFKKQEDGFGFEEESTKVQAGFKRILSLWDDTICIGQDSEPFHIRGVASYDLPDQAETGLKVEEDQYVAALVEDLIKSHRIAEKTRINPKGKDSQEFENTSRPVEARDIMILTRSNKETGVYLRALKDRGIPALLAGEKTLGDTREVLNLYILIDALLDYRDKIKMVAALRNCFYLDLETIDLFLEDHGDLSTLVFNKDLIEKIEHPHIASALMTMRELINQIRKLSPISFVETIVANERGIYDLDRYYSDLERRDVEGALIQTVELLKASRSASIYEIRAELENLVNREVNYELPLSSEVGDNSVRVMNIHKAKGLEANIVFLVGSDKRSNLGLDSYYIEKDKNNQTLGYMAFSSKHGIVGPNEIQKKETEKAFKEAENHRLLYVAATRAKSALIIGRAEEEKMFLYPLNRNITKSIEVELVESKPRQEHLGLAKLKERELTRELRQKKRVLNPSFYRISPSQFSYSKDPQIDLISATSPGFKSFTAQKLRIQEIGPRGKVYGTIVHRALEILIDRSNGLNKVDDDLIDYASRQGIKESIEGLEINKNNLSPFYPLRASQLEEVLDCRLSHGNKIARNMVEVWLKPFVMEVVENFVNNSQIQDIFENSQRIFTELNFSIGLKRDSRQVLDKLSNLLKLQEIQTHGEKTIVVNGVIDLLVEGKDGSWTILDYKTDVLRGQGFDKSFIRAYGAQLEGYKLLLEEILKVEEVEIGNLLIYSSFNDCLIHIMEAALA